MPQRECLPRTWPPADADCPEDRRTPAQAAFYCGILNSPGKGFFQPSCFSKEGKIIRGSLSGEVVWREGLGRGKMRIIGTIAGWLCLVNSPTTPPPEPGLVSWSPGRPLRRAPCFPNPLKFFVFERGASHFHFALAPRSHVTSPAKRVEEPGGWIHGVKAGLCHSSAMRAGAERTLTSHLCLDVLSDETSPAPLPCSCWGEEK